MTQPANAALLVIDVQEGLDDPRYGQRNNPDAEKHIADLLAGWRASGRPVIHIQHMSTNPESPLRAGEPGNEIKAEARPVAGEPILRKNVNSAFIGTDLELRLRTSGISDLVVAGLTTQHCVSTTVRMAANLGFNVTLVADATAAHSASDHDGNQFDAEMMHRTALASLNGEFASVRNSAEVLAELR